MDNNNTGQNKPPEGVWCRGYMVVRIFGGRKVMVMVERSRSGF